MSDDAKKVILARRARFLAAALASASLACGKEPGHAGCARPCLEPPPLRDADVPPVPCLSPPPMDIDAGTPPVPCLSVPMPVDAGKKDAR